MRVSAKVDYAVRAAIELAAAQPGVRVKAEHIAEAQDIPRKFLDNILQGLRQSGLVVSRRGPDGGHQLARAAEEISIADIIRAIDGPLANVGGRFPEDVRPPGVAEPMQEVWVAVRAALRGVLEETSLADVAQGKLPKSVHTLSQRPGAWERR